ncbi:MAG: A/G-specific adenine glycosylase [Mediterranea sp.]|jgi:A/G-specific adenine glycosylase|nr:A/G-specific adenine glycosylase [Mediterranea sp.]
MSIFTDTMLEWYASHKRELPWRDTSDPYIIWISEIILQQTRVEQGRDYFLRFVGRFPDARTLADASDDEVMTYWQGLGYYSRARNLLAAARAMNGTFPSTYQGVLALPGVGEYTAAAICSFAYGMPYAVVDGNVYRVLARYFGIDTPIDTIPGKRLFAALADEMLDRLHPALYNQAIMDFGATQCVPRSPTCATCPLADSCAALASGRVASLPVKRHRTKTTDRYLYYLYVRAGTYTFIHKRTADDIWKGLFELPLIEATSPLSPDEFLAHPSLQAMFAPGERRELRLVCQGVKHLLSHRVLHADLYEVTLPEDTASFSSFLKIRREALGEYAVPRLVQLLVEAIPPDKSVGDR